MDTKLKNELMKIRSMASMVIEKIDDLIPDAEKGKKRGGLTQEERNKILAHRRLVRMR